MCARLYTCICPKSVGGASEVCHFGTDGGVGVQWGEHPQPSPGSLLRGSAGRSTTGSKCSEIQSSGGLCVPCALQATPLPTPTHPPHPSTFVVGCSAFNEPHMMVADVPDGPLLLGTDRGRILG